MYTFPILIKKIRDQAGLTQAEFARELGVSAVLVAMIETGQKEVSKNLLIKLAERLDVHPSSITPFLFTNKDSPLPAVSGIEKMFLNWGEQMQTYLIDNRSKRLRKHA